MLEPITTTLPPLTDDERAVYDWQFGVGGFGEEGQRRLKAATVLISRVGGLGGSVAWQLAAAGVGRLVLAHAGNIKPSDLNRQTLMTHDAIGAPRLESAVARLRAFNPRLDVVTVPENASPANVLQLAAGVDIIVDCAPLFAERFALNHASVALRKPMIECAVNDLELHLTTLVPGRSPCLRCLYPEENPLWTRRFPVLGAVSGAAGSLAATEVIKWIAGMEGTLVGHMLIADLRSMEFRKLRVRRLPDCPECAGLPDEGELP
ncbi:MAG TPA: HesA/MoeB/ThiF family protein [Verrucomicrobiae bacterium]|nr:HesA/MoeB/ThiF family protein [Verrucomicrobiae bacterium]